MAGTPTDGISLLYTSAWFIGEIGFFFLVDYLLSMRGPSRHFDSKVAAFEIAPTAVSLVLVVKGIMLFSVADLFKGTRHDRMYSHVDGVPQLLMIEFAHCCAETVLGLIVEPPRLNPELIIHHVIAAIMVLTCFAPYGHAFMPFACGISHITDLALLAASFFEVFPTLNHKLPRAKFFAKLTYGIIFFIVRLLMWMPVFAIFMLDNLSGALNGTNHNGLVVFVTMIGACVLTVFQILWFVRICKYACCRPAKKQNYKSY